MGQIQPTLHNLCATAKYHVSGLGVEADVELGGSSDVAIGATPHHGDASNPIHKGGIALKCESQVGHGANRQNPSTGMFASRLDQVPGRILTRN